MTDPAPLSPTAQAVLNAINKELDEAPWDVSFLAGASAAAALRAAADQTRKQRLCPTMGWAVKDQDFCLVSDLEAIAAELEGAR